MAARAHSPHSGITIIRKSVLNGMAAGSAEVNGAIKHGGALALMGLRMALFCLVRTRAAQRWSMSMCPFQFLDTLRHMGIMQFEWTAASLDPERSVKVFCTDRRDGLSSPPWDEFNLALHVGDSAQAVQANRQILTDALGVPLAWVQQVHGVRVHRVSEGGEHAVAADALLTTEAGVALSMMVADCLPVLLSHRNLPCIVAAHAGWRGLSAGVLEASMAAMAQATGERADQVAAQTSAWLGPCIGPRHFEVGQDVWDAFVQQEAEDAVGLRAAARPGHYWADLAQLAKMRLSRLGVKDCQGNDSTAPWCTATNPNRYFSHRRDAGTQGSTGRMAFGVWITG
jgi:YfiH family protein